MLDDLKMIHQRDPQDALGFAEKQWQQLLENYPTETPKLGKLQNIVIAAMGGSALPATFLTSWPDIKLPLEIIRNYDLPTYVGSETLFIACSYSGNTEETLSALTEAEGKGAQIVVMSHGGKLEERAKDKNYSLFAIPTGIQPRMCSFYFLAAFLQLLEPLGLVPAGSLEELRTTAKWLGEQTTSWRPEVPTKDNPTKQLALELIGKSVVVYSGPKMFPAANKFKVCLNENAKNVAWVNQYPEFNHNEFMGWTSHPVQKPYAVVEIRSSLEHPRVQKRFTVSERLLSGRRPQPFVIEPRGDSLLQQLLWSAIFCDFTSIYTALLNGVDPTPIDLIEQFKHELNK